MTISIDLPDMTAVPVWVWWTAGITAWYTLAIWITRWFHADKPYADGAVRFVFWSMSPAILPIFALFYLFGWFGDSVLTPKAK